MKRSDIDVAVIGSGPAGMAAAIRAKEEGAEHVLILERQEQLGGGFCISAFTTVSAYSISSKT